MNSLEHLTLKQKQCIEATFSFLDTNNDQHLNKNETITLLRCLGQTGSTKDLLNKITPYFVETKTGSEKKNNVEDNVKKNVEDNVKKNVEDNIKKNVEDNIKKNVEDNIKKNVEDNIKKNVEDNTKKNVEDNTKQNVEDNTKQNEIDIKTFLSLFQQHYTSPINENSLIEAFLCFDEEFKGRLSFNELEHILTFPGTEPFTCDELNDLFTHLKTVYGETSTIQGVDTYDLTERLIYGPSHMRQ